MYNNQSCVNLVSSAMEASVSIPSLDLLYMLRQRSTIELHALHSVASGSLDNVHATPVDT